MAKAHLNNLGEHGLIYEGDFPSFELPPQDINNGLNFKFKNGLIVRSDGWFDLNFNLVGTPFDGYKFYTGTILNAGTANGMIFLLYKATVLPRTFKRFPGAETRGIPASIKLALWDGDASNPLVDISPADTPEERIEYLGEPQLFSFLGSVYLNTQSGRPYVYRPWETVIAPAIPIFKRIKLAKWIDGGSGIDHYSVTFLTTFYNHLIGVGSVDESTQAAKPYEVFWSDVFEDPDTDPDWNAKPENEAGSTILPDTYRNAFTAVPLGNNLIIYTLTATFRLYPIGLPLVFGLEKIFPNIGCVSTNCVREFEGNHFVATANNAYVHNGNTIKSVAEGKIAKMITAEAQNYTSLNVFHNILNKEMWIYFADSSLLNFGTKAIIYNYSTDQWSIDEVPQVSYIIEAIAFNKKKKWSDPDSLTETYNDIAENYDYLQRDSANFSFFYISQTGNSSVYQYFPNNYKRDGNVDKKFTTMFERSHLDLMALTEGQKDLGLQKYIYEMILYMKGEGEVKIEITSQMGSLGPEKLKETHTYSLLIGPWDELKEYKVNLRVTGRYIDYKISKDDFLGMEIKSIQFGYKVRGVR